VAVRAAGAYAFLCAGDFAGFEQTLDEMLEIVGDDGAVGTGIVLGSPVAWALMGKGMVRREQLEFDEAERLFDRALHVALAEDDPETASWVRSNQAGMMAMRGNAEAGLGAARRNVELTDKLGDVFSRSLALSNLAWIELNAGEAEEALRSIEEAERLYRDAMGSGGEMEAWRGQLRAQALTAVGRPEEAVEVAEEAAAIARQRGMMWTYPVAMLALSRALRAAGRDGGLEALEESERVARLTGAMALLADLELEKEVVGAGAEGSGRPLA
jgi:tetratricopeptide (TPR) repeat protein